MNQLVEPSDECPHCRLPLEILSVKVGLRGSAMVYACTNCAMTRTENLKQQVLWPPLGALRMCRRLGGDTRPSATTRSAAHNGRQHLARLCLHESA